MAAFGQRSVNGRSRVPSPAQRIIPFTRVSQPQGSRKTASLGQRRNVAGGDLAQVGEIGQSLERARGIAQRGGNGEQEARTALHPSDVLESPGGLALALNGER